jgi:YgiT-type zinc finger domain-containing protein
MSTGTWKETMLDQEVTYTLDIGGKLIMIEHVPARVCLKTGEQFFSPETVERIQRTIWEQKKQVVSLRRLFLTSPALPDRRPKCARSENETYLPGACCPVSEKAQDFLSRTSDIRIVWSQRSCSGWWSYSEAEGWPLPSQPFQVDHQSGQCRRGDAGDSGGLAQADRSDPGELLHRLCG